MNSSEQNTTAFCEKKKATERETNSKVKWEANYSFMITFEKKKRSKNKNRNSYLANCRHHMCVTHCMLITWDSLLFIMCVERYFVSLHILRKGSMSILCIEKPTLCNGKSCAIIMCARARERTVSSSQVLDHVRLNDFKTSCGLCSTNWWQNIMRANVIGLIFRLVMEKKTQTVGDSCGFLIFRCKRHHIHLKVLTGCLIQFLRNFSSPMQKSAPHNDTSWCLSSVFWLSSRLVR